MGIPYPLQIPLSEISPFLIERVKKHMADAKNLLGQSTLSMTERYSHPGNGTLQEAVKRLEGSLLKATRQTR
jgi:hypothetical protein